MVKFPDDWLADERYGFNWQALETDADPFQSLQF
jgi:hypothetical protein